MHRLICDNEKCPNIGKGIGIKRKDYIKALRLEFYCNECKNCLKLQKFNKAKGWWEYVDERQKGLVKMNK
jgi:hypothetical protein